jgi:hypothetical protein
LWLGNFVLQKSKFAMSFSKEKTITVTSEDFLSKDWVVKAEFIGDDRKPYLVQAVFDGDCESPRKWDNLWTWATTQGAGYSDKGALRLDDITEELHGNTFQNNYLFYHLYLYRHSGDILSVSNTGYPFNDQFDAGCIGIAYLSKKK